MLVAPQRKRQGLVPDFLVTHPQGFEALLELKVVGGGPTLYEHNVATGLVNVYGACWFDLYVPAVWFVVAFCASVLLLAYCVRDPH